MNRFATISNVYRFKRVTFYTLTLSDSGIPMFYQFRKRHLTAEYRADMEVLRTWMENMGNLYGASSDYFREEGLAQAIPPGIGITHKHCTLRLYCLRMSHKVVILLDGGAKTKQKAQDCPIVGPHFVMANLLAAALWKALDNGLIAFDEKDDLVLPPNLKIPL